MLLGLFCFFFVFFSPLLLTVFMCYIQQFVHTDTGKRIKRSSRIRMVDLAGSEKSSKTGATGERLQEGMSINLSLTTINNVFR